LAIDLCNRRATHLRLLPCREIDAEQFLENVAWFGQEVIAAFEAK
jgi:hypothetical protein